MLNDPTEFIKKVLPEGKCPSCGDIEVEILDAHWFCCGCKMQQKYDELEDDNGKN